MLWVINGLIYGFFTALYTLVNQHYKFNGYLLGIWRGYGIALCFFPALFFLPIPDNAYYYFLLITQGILIGIYDSHLFFASAAYGAGPTSRVMALSAFITTVFWWILTPHLFWNLFKDGTVFITLILIMFGFTFSYWRMLKSPVSKSLIYYMFPVIFAFAGMSIITKEIAMHGSNVWQGVAVYLVVATFVSGTYNTFFYIKTVKPGFIGFFRNVFEWKIVKVGLYIVGFSWALITSKTLALRIAPNPGYVIALLLTSPIFVFLMNKYNKVTDNISVRAGFSMIFFLVLLLILVNGNYGVVD